MRLSKKIANTISLLYLTAAAILVFSTCKPAIGTPWYQRSAGPNETNTFVITDIQVKKIPVTAVLAEPPIDDTDKLKKFSEAKAYIVVIPPEVEEISAEDIMVTAVADLAKKEPLAINVTLNGDGVPLTGGLSIPVTVKIADAAGDYAVLEKVITITRNEPYPLTLVDLTICGKSVMDDSVTVDYKFDRITAKHIAATFEYGGSRTVLPVDLGVPSVKLYENEPVEVTLSVKGKEGQYQAFEKTVSIMRETRPAGAAAVLEVDSIHILGYRCEIGKELGVPEDTEQITENDVVAFFKDFGELPVKLNPNPAVFGTGDTLTLTLSIDEKPDQYQKWDISFTVKKDPTALNNPQDKQGNRKYITKVKTIIEEQSPFDYYKEDYEFPAAKFDNWVLVMPSMSGIISSYKFQPGSWSGNPEMIDNIPSSIGSGEKAISNVKIYRYKSRAERWSAHGGYVPAADTNDSRFYFYRFTATAKGGIKPDSSLFCVDRYSKFLFYYSEPSNIEWIFGNAVPKDWVDYATATKGDHLQFTEPFYMSDPVGYVKEDGSVVIYSWLKNNINNAKYHAQKNSAYTKPAAKSPGKPGYSPYRDNIINKRNEVEKTENSAYTVAVPVILGQPKAIRIKPNAPEEVAFTVKTAPAPKGEELSYQWYENERQSNEGGIAISGATSPVYAPDKSAEKSCYVYCVVTNTNKSNSQTETVASRAVKLLISNGTLAVDALEPHVKQQPSGKIFSVKAPEEKRKMELKIEAVSLDKGTLSYQWYKNTTGSTSDTGTLIPDATKDSYSFTVGTTIGIEYYYCKVTNTNNAVDGNKTASVCSDFARVEVEESYQVRFGTEGDGTLTAICGQELLDPDPEKQAEKYITKGKKVTFFAQAKDGWEVEDWVGHLTKIAEDKLSADLTVTKQETVTVKFRKIPDTRKLTITAKKLENIDMGGWDFITKAWGEQVDHAYFVYDFRARVFKDNATDGEIHQLWGRAIGGDLSGAGSINQAERLYKKGKGPNLTGSPNDPMQQLFDSKPDHASFQLDTKLVKYDRAAGWGTCYKQYLSDYNKSVVEFNYDKEKDEWTWKKADIPGNFPSISDYTFSVELPPPFVLKRGQSKDFTIRYYIDRDAPTYAKGTVAVTYTLKWE